MSPDAERWSSRPRYSCGEYHGEPLLFRVDLNQMKFELLRDQGDRAQLAEAHQRKLLALTPRSQGKFRVAN